MNKIAQNESGLLIFLELVRQQIRISTNFWALFSVRLYFNQSQEKLLQNVFLHLKRCFMSS